MAVTRTARGSATSKTSGTTLQIAAQSLNAGDLLVVSLAYDDQTLNSVTWGTQTMTLGDPVLGAGVRTRLAWCIADATASRTITATWAASLTAKAMVADSYRSSVTGGGQTWNVDSNATDVGLGTAASTPATAPIVGGTESVRVGVVGTEGPSGDTAGTWVVPSTAGQRVGTTGNPAASNVTVSSAYLIAPTAGSTSGLSKTGMTSRDWGAGIRSFYWAAPKVALAGSSTGASTGTAAMAPRRRLEGTAAGAAVGAGVLTTTGSGSGPAYQTHTSASQTGATWTGTEPAGTAQGDYLLAHLALDSPADFVQTPATGWTLIRGPIDSAADTRGYLYGIVRGASAPALQWAMNAAGADGALHIIRYAGVDPDNPVNAHDATGTASASTHASPSIVPTVDGCLIVGLAHVDKSSTQTPYWTPPGGYTERYDFEDAAFIESTAADKVQTTAASVSVTFTGNDSDEGVVFIVALRPTAGPGVVALTGTATGAAVGTAALTGRRGLTATAAGAGTATAALTGRRRLTGAATAAATATAAAQVRRRLTATATGTASTSAAMAPRRRLSGSAVGTSTTAGAVVLDVALAGSSTGVATADGDLTTQQSIVDLTGSATGTSTAAAGLTARRLLTGAAAGTSTTAAVPTLRRRLLGSAVGTGSAAGAITLELALAGAAAGTGAGTGVLAPRRRLGGTAAGVATATAAVVIDVALAGTAAGSSFSTGTMAGGTNLIGSAPGTSTATGALRVRRTLTAAATGAATATGDATLRRRLAGAATGAATAAADVTLLRRLAGTAAGTSAASAPLRFRIALAGAAAGMSTAALAAAVIRYPLSATLSVGGKAAGEIQHRSTSGTVLPGRAAGATIRTRKNAGQVT